MPISFAEQQQLTCPACSTAFSTDVWMLIDAAERPDLAQALRDATLNIVACPSCGALVSADSALLFHDPAQRRVYFAVPPRSDEHAWREQAQTLLYQLFHSLPNAERLTYLSDVQVEQELDGVRRGLLRHERRRGGRATTNTTQSRTVTPSTPAVPTEPRRQPTSTNTHQAQPTPPIMAAVHALLAANDDAEVAAIIAEYPALRDEHADVLLRQLADQAYAEGDRALSSALHKLRNSLTQTGQHPSEPHIDESTSSTPPVEQTGTSLAPQLPTAAYQALLRVAGPQDLLAAVRDYPMLLESWADADLAARTEAAIDEGNEHLAYTIESYREILAELHSEISNTTVLRTAIQTLLAATTQDALASAFNTYPILLTDATPAALAELAADADAQGDAALAQRARECQQLVGTIRSGLLDDH